MTTRQESEGDGKVARSYSLASAPLRLLSHSFHSTANTHSPPPSGSNSPVSHPGCDPTPPRHHEPSTSVSSASFDLKTETTIATNNFHNTLHASPTLPQPQPQPQHHVLQLDPRREARESKRQAQQLFDSDISSHEDICGRLSKAIKLEAAPWSPKQEMAESPDHTSPSLSLQSAEAQQLERLLLPYDIRYSIFGQLSLQDLYNLQLVCTTKSRPCMGHVVYFPCAPPSSPSFHGSVFPILNIPLHPRGNDKRTWLCLYLHFP